VFKLTQSLLTAQTKGMTNSCWSSSLRDKKPVYEFVIEFYSQNIVVCCFHQRMFQLRYAHFIVIPLIPQTSNILKNVRETKGVLVLIL